MQEFDNSVQMAKRAEQLFKDGCGSELLQVTLGFIYTKTNEKEKANKVFKRFFNYAAENTIEDPWTL